MYFAYPFKTFLLRFCLVFRSGSGPSGLSECHSEENGAICERMAPRDHVGDPEISSTGWLTISRRVMFSQLCHLFKARIGLAPSYLSVGFCPMQQVHHHNTRGSSLNYFVDSQKFPPGTFHYAAVREWNQIPQELKGIPTLSCFKKRLRQYMS